MSVKNAEKLETISQKLFELGENKNSEKRDEWHSLKKEAKSLGWWPSHRKHFKVSDETMFGIPGMPEFPGFPDLPGNSDGTSFGAACDSNDCLFEKSHEPLSSGHSTVFIQDDQDTTTFSVVCESGEIEVVFARATWSDWTEWGRKTLKAGETWTDTFGQLTSGLDQTVSMQIFAHSDCYYGMSFHSKDL